MTSLMVISQTPFLVHLSPFSVISFSLEWLLHSLCLPKLPPSVFSTDHMLQPTRFLPAPSTTLFPKLSLSPLSLSMHTAFCPWHSLLNVSLVSLIRGFPGVASLSPLLFFLTQRLQTDLWLEQPTCVLFGGSATHCWFKNLNRFQALLQQVILLEKFQCLC